jgi:hypothetical protein
MAVIQSKSSYIGPSQAAVCLVNSAPTPGNSNIVVITTTSATPPGIATLTDSLGSIYTLIAGPTANGNLTQWIYLGVIA